MSTYALRLPLRFEAAPILDELRAASPDWRSHFNQAYHDGGWQLLSLRASRDAALPDAPGSHPAESYVDLPVAAQFPLTRALLERLPPASSVRFMQLQAGSEIAEHSDPAAADSAPSLRLHLPLQGAAGTLFYLAGERIPMREGESWALDITQRHRVRNRGPLPRIHLVVDCPVGPALQALLHHADHGEPYPDKDDPLLDCRRFIARCLEQPDTLDALQALSGREQLVRAVRERGAQAGLDFTDSDVVSLLDAGRRVWIEQFIV